MPVRTIEAKHNVRGDRSAVVSDNLPFCLDRLVTHHPFRTRRAVVRKTRNAGPPLEWLELDEPELEDVHTS
jgi:hypothetical protein